MLAKLVFCFYVQQRLKRHCMFPTDRGSSITSGITSNLVESLIGTGNSANAGSSAGIPKPSAAALLLAGLAAIYIRMT